MKNLIVSKIEIYTCFILFMYDCMNLHKFSLISDNQIIITT